MFTIINNSSRVVWATRRWFSRGHTSPDFVAPHWSTSGWWGVNPGGISRIGDSDSNTFVRMTFDNTDGPLVVPNQPGGQPIQLLTHNTSAFEFRKESDNRYTIYISGTYRGTQTVNDAVRNLNCRVREGFYPYSSNLDFTVGGPIPPSGTVRSSTWNFDHRAGAMQTTNINQAFDAPAGSTVVNHQVNVTSNRRALVTWQRAARLVRLQGSVRGENVPFGAGGVYQGSVTVTYRY